MSKMIGWKVTETVEVGLTDICLCDSCGKLLGYNAVRPYECPKCGGLVTLHLDAPPMDAPRK
jgi:hypothetical protein